VNARGHAVILVNHHRNMGKLIHRGLHHRPQKRRAGIFASAGTGLHDHRGVGFVCGFHNRPGLLQVVDVKCRHSIAVFGGVVQQLSHTD